MAERALQELCLEYGFPAEERFKWSPGRELWMRDNLQDAARQDFFLRVLDALGELGCKAIVVLVDSSFACATSRIEIGRDLDAVRYLIRRTAEWLSEVDEFGVMLMDQPGGGPAQQHEFSSNCARYTANVSAGDGGRRIVVAPVATDSGLVRLLQAADLVTSCTLAHVSGELTYSPPIFEAIRDLLWRADRRVGDVGLVIRPSFRYLNLYRWLLGDGSYKRGSLEAPLPLPRRPYNAGEWAL